MKRTLYGVVAVVLVAVLAAPAVAEPATTSITGPTQVQPGDTVTYTFTVTNTGGNESGYLLDATLPDGWAIVERSDDGGRWKASENQWLWLSIEPDITKATSLTLSVPANTSASSVTVTSRASNSDGLQDVATKEVTVEDDDGSGGGGSDDGGTYGGGSDDGGPSDSEANATGSEANAATDSETNAATDSEQNTATGSEPDPSTESEAVGTAGGSASEPTDESATDSASETGDEAGASDTGGGTNTALGMGIGALVVLAVGVGIGTARWNAAGESAATDTASGDVEAESGTTASDDVETESGTTASGATDDGVSASGDEGGTGDIDVLDLQKGSAECTITYSTAETSNKAIGDEIREIAQGYASAGADDIGTQRLEATITDGEQTVATWHIRSEWLCQLENGELSAETFERKVLGTICFSS
ncbi:hypothetical protein NDI56_09850 [Haloarcula sp. S1CR25-12]|uniref:DUF11 domain-containing protein n=1 Tax=Haloarcula saliterrae TaxID=2950534 RepID=A0ABU2FBP9_9EURY|nr:hypothetical protein [Haloarcula sp. S1CR25-12]MDS0259694.1 hypothetical protein [Haloarcula sp. S1CR25-12]